jgi:hypothetical protein
MGLRSIDQLRNQGLCVKARGFVRRTMFEGIRLPPRRRGASHALVMLPAFEGLWPTASLRPLLPHDIVRRICDDESLFCDTRRDTMPNKGLGHRRASAIAAFPRKSPASKGHRR